MCECIQHLERIEINLPAIIIILILYPPGVCWRGYILVFTLYAMLQRENELNCIELCLRPLTNRLKIGILQCKMSAQSSRGMKRFINSLPYNIVTKRNALCYGKNIHNLTWPITVVSSNLGIGTGSIFENIPIWGLS